MKNKIMYKITETINRLINKILTVPLKEIDNKRLIKVFFFFLTNCSKEGKRHKPTKMQPK